MMTEFPLTLSVSAELPNERVARLTRDLARDLTRADIKTLAAASAPVPGERGDPVTLGALALGVVTGGALKALIACLKAYISREPALVIKIKRKDGMQVEINARNVDTPDLQAALHAVASVV